MQAAVEFLSGGALATGARLLSGAPRCVVSPNRIVAVDGRKLHRRQSCSLRQRLGWSGPARLHLALSSTYRGLHAAGGSSASCHRRLDLVLANDREGVAGNRTALVLAAASALTLAAWPRWSSDNSASHDGAPMVSVRPSSLSGDQSRPRFWVCGILLVLAGGSFAGKIAAPLNYWTWDSRVGTLRTPDNGSDLWENLGRWIKPGDSLFSFPYLPSAYFFLDARNPTRYSYLQPGMMNGQDEETAVHELQANPPKWVVYEKFPPRGGLTKSGRGAINPASR